MSRSLSLAAAPPPRAPSSVPRAADLFLAGVGSVGQALLQQVADLPEGGPRLRVIGACTTRHSFWKTSGLASPEAAGALLREGPPPDWSRLFMRLGQPAHVPRVFVDATGSKAVPRFYEPLLRAGVSVVTPSKLANTQGQDDFDRLQAATHAAGASYRYETTVGAGLPVVQTVHNLVATGDRIHSIRGAVSGTLTFVFDRLRQGALLSEAVREAAAQGYAEPDVRDDLSGEDVARKFLILARTAGLSLERADIEVESLVPEALCTASTAAFLRALPQVDASWQERVAKAQADDVVLQYTGSLSEDGVRVGVQRVPAEAPLGRLRGTDNLIEIYSDRYATSPIVVQGPGAGPAVTAAGVLADVLAAAAHVDRVPAS